MSLIKIAVVDDHVLLCESLSCFINNIPEMKVVIEANSGMDFFDKLAKSDVIPDIILLDLNMDKMDGWEVLRVMKSKNLAIKVLIITMNFSASLVENLFKDGASGYLYKGSKSEELIMAIRGVINNGFYIDKKIRAEMNISKIREINQLVTNLPVNDCTLNEKELDVLKLICKQKTNKEIAEELNTSVKAIEFHRSNLLKKTKSTNVVGLVHYAISRKISFDLKQ